MTAPEDRTEIRALVRRLGKPPEEWRRADLVRFCVDDGIRVINLRYPSLEGKLRELRLPVNDAPYVDRVLAAGERVDGSSLFPGLFGTGNSDLYVVPVYRWAFLNPWAADELDIVCRFADADGAPSTTTPDAVVAQALRRLRESTGAELLGLVELEFYLLLDRLDARFSGKAQRNYHQGTPYVHGRQVADEILRTVSAVMGRVKYCHSEVGYIDRLESELAELDGRRVEQYELELDLMPLEELAVWLPVARWLIRTVADRHGASVTFTPKLDEDMAGSGMHLHLALARDGNNAMSDPSGELSDDALGLIGGILGRAASLSAFANSVASSYLRLVPDQEAPTAICWGRRNRSTLLRVPLDFRTEARLDRLFNPAEEGAYPDLARPSVEYRGPDGSAYAQPLLGAITLAVQEGLSAPSGADRARRLEIALGERPGPDLDQLPTSAVAAARCLLAERSFYERGGFPPPLLNVIVSKLAEEADEGLRARLRGLPAAERLVESRRVMHKDLHKH